MPARNQDLGRASPGLRGLALRWVSVLWPLLRSKLSREPSMAALLRTTRAVTVIRAGDAANVIPDEARAVPGSSRR